PRYAMHERRSATRSAVMPGLCPAMAKCTDQQVFESGPSWLRCESEGYEGDCGSWADVYGPVGDRLFRGRRYERRGASHDHGHDGFDTATDNNIGHTVGDALDRAGTCARRHEHHGLSRDRRRTLRRRMPGW